MNAKDRRFLNQAQTAVAFAGVLVTLGVLPRNWKRGLVIAGATMGLILLLAD